MMLAITADGDKLPPTVIFRRKTIPKDRFLQGIIVRLQGGWMMELTLKWLKVVWKRQPGALLHECTMFCTAFVDI
jgi:hypothetical protein